MSSHEGLDSHRLLGVERGKLPWRVPHTGGCGEGRHLRTVIDANDHVWQMYWWCNTFSTPHGPRRELWLHLPGEEFEHQIHPDGSERPYEVDGLRLTYPVTLLVVGKPE